MNRFNASNRHAASAAALLLSAGLASTAAAVDKHWTCNANSSWNNAACWSPFGLPAAADDVNVGNVAGVQNTSAILDINESINNLSITDGMTVNVSNGTLDVNLETRVSGRNVVGFNAFPSRLLVNQVVNGPEVTTGPLTILDDAVVELNGGGILVGNTFSIGEGCALRGVGTIDHASNFLNLRNDGVISPGNGPLTLRQNGPGTFDIDGVFGGGDLDLTASSNAFLTFEGDGIFDSFGGTLDMIRGTRLHMDLAEPWGVEATGVFNIYGAGTGASARITGAPLNFAGTINVFGGAVLSHETDATFNTGAEAVLGIAAVADFNGDTLVNDGLFTVFQESAIEFDGPTELRGGAFVTQSGAPEDGNVKFNGATTWNGSVSFTGFATQNGPATVSGVSTINADTFDMDGSNAADWEIDANLTVNADRIDEVGSVFNTTMDIGAGRLTVNLTDPAHAWTLAGTTNLSGNSLLFTSKIGAGSPLTISGVVNVNGKIDISTDSTVQSTSTINIAAASSALRFFADAVVGANVTFTGSGMLQSGGLSELTLNSGLSTGSVGLSNAGRLRVGAAAGIASVDRFTTIGTWAVDIGGPVAGTQHDRVISNGPASLGGTLEVSLISGFQPVVGDQFTILNAVGGVSGSFAPGVTTTVNATTYHWDVIVSGSDVIVRLASIDLPCRADFNMDGFVNSQDFFDFLTPFFAANPAADINADGFVNSQDFFDFLTSFFAGCP